MHNELKFMLATVILFRELFEFTHQSRKGVTLIKLARTMQRDLVGLSGTNKRKAGKSDHQRRKQ